MTDLTHAHDVMLEMFNMNLVVGCVNRFS